MSTPEGYKELWRNVKWSDDKEKLAFFNHYFKNSKMVVDHVKTTVDSIKEKLIGFIEEGKIKEKDKERDITMKDVIEDVNSL